MKRLSILLLVVITALLLFGTFQPALAQDVTPVPEVTAVAPQPSVPVYVTNEPKVLGETVPANTFVIVILVFGGTFIAVFVGYAYSQHKTTQMVWQSTPKPIQQTGQIALETLMTEAEKTETPLDNLTLDAVADKLGYDKTVLSDGRIVLTQRLPQGST